MKGIIEKALRSELSEILSIQKAAFAPIAALLNKPELQPMTQTLTEIETEYANWLFLKYTLEGRIVGSVRAYLDKSDVCHIGKLVVLPEYQSAGIGKALMQAVHEAYKNCNSYELFTGKHVPHIVDFYRRLGYAEKNTKSMDGVVMVFMERGNNLKLNA
jgi:N-acetylglutamate synthase-like GNAT family acetyltransferase